MIDRAEQSERPKNRSAAVYAWVRWLAVMLIVMLLAGVLLEFFGSRTTPHQSGSTEGATVGNSSGSGSGDGTGSDIVGRKESDDDHALGPAGNDAKTDNRVEAFAGPAQPVDSKKSGHSVIDLDENETAPPGLIDENIQLQTAKPPVALAGKSSPKAGASNLALQGKTAKKNIFQDANTESAKRIVYLIDCSGSMAGNRFELARKELAASVASLKNDQLFYIVFFNDGPIEMTSKNMLRGAPSSVKKVAKWMSTVSAGGDTKVAESMKIALSKRPDLIWLLTDGIIYDAPQAEEVINAYREKNSGAKFKINTVAFIDPSGEALLKEWAQRYGGTYKFVSQ